MWYWEFYFTEIYFLLLICLFVFFFLAEFSAMYWSKYLQISQKWTFHETYLFSCKYTFETFSHMPISTHSPLPSKYLSTLGGLFLTWWQHIFDQCWKEFDTNAMCVIFMLKSELVIWSILKVTVCNLHRNTIKIQYEASGLCCTPEWFSIDFSYKCPH